MRNTEWKMQNVKMENGKFTKCIFTLDVYRR